MTDERDTGFGDTAIVAQVIASTTKPIFAAKHARRQELRKANVAAWTKGGVEAEASARLDSSLKRNTAFVKRLRTSLHSADALAALQKEVREVSLEKYTGELVTAAIEGLSRCKTGQDINIAIEVLSSLHQRFPLDFTDPLQKELTEQLQTPSRASVAAAIAEQREKDDAVRITRQRSLLRLYAEMELAGLLKPDKKAALGELTFAVLKDLLTADKDSLLSSVPLAVTFVKHEGYAFLQQSEYPDAAATARIDSCEVVPTVQDRVRKLLMAYYDALSRRAVKDHLQLLETDQRNNDAYIKYGEIFEDRSIAYEKMTKAWERLWAGVQSLSEALGANLPDLPKLLANSAGLTAVNNRAHGDGIVGQSSTVWSDGEEERFYTDLLDLRGEVPMAMLISTAEDKASDTLAKTADADTDFETLDEDVSIEAGDERLAEDNVDVTSALAVNDGIAPAPAAQLGAFLGRLPDMVSIAAIDTAAIEFAFLNSKAARKRLTQHLGGVPRIRQDLLPYYSRLIATLSKYMPDIGQGVVAIMQAEFRYLAKRKGKDMGETRSKNIRYLSELAKFGITPPHTILHVFKASIDDFTPVSIENICHLLETCGRFLLRSPSTAERMSIMMDNLQRKRGSLSLDQHLVTMLDNAYYHCNPPDRAAVQRKEQPPMHAYIHNLVYNLLTKPDLDLVIILVRKLHWEDPAIVRKLFNAFTKVWKAKFSNVYLFAMILHDLTKYHSEFCVSVVDGVLENIVAGMEHNNYNFNQQRVATMKYLGELYIYHLVDSRVILDTLWCVVTFGHTNGRPTPDALCEIDTPSDFFRIRLICTLLDTCGMYFDRGTIRRDMDAFLAFFQLYVRSKQSLPMDIDFMLSDTFERLRPKMKLHPTYEDAAIAIDKLARQGNGSSQDATMCTAHDRDASDTESVRNAANDTMSESDDDSQASDAESAVHMDDAAISLPDDEQPDSDDDDSAAEDMTALDRADFELELARMMSETRMDSKATSALKSGVSEINVSAIRRQAQQMPMEDASGNDHMPFIFLTKKGVKYQTRSMEIPVDSSIAVTTRRKQEESRKEQQHLKRLVLDYEQREEAENKKQLVDQAARRGIRLRFDSNG